MKKSVNRDVLVVAALVMVAGVILGHNQVEARAVALNHDLPDFEADELAKKPISEDDKLMLMRLFMEEPEDGGDTYLSPRMDSSNTVLRFPRLRISDFKRPSSKRQMIFHPCYFNPVSCFRRR